MMTKKEARKVALQLRKNENSILASEEIVRQIVNSNILMDYNNIGIYYPIGTEISILELMNIYPSKNFYLPITKDEISFVLYKTNDLLIPAQFHTFEPIGETVCREKIECFLIPCVAINQKKQRIGYGKGFYDRYLQGFNGKKIGICYQSGAIDCQTDDYDLFLDIVYYA